ncbi:thiamine pyrophosphate-binding protein [Streptomyces sp. NPDC057092]|uniref:thiamine pyrophosphate-binding protein n=1 Tax=Streptomyces sp. NPDC057092 TaxID=3346017 RepID=UPI003626B30D
MKRTIKATSSAESADSASDVYSALTTTGFGPFFATPCGVLAPLLSLLEQRSDYHVVAREDSAVGMAAGVSLVRGLPVVLMQNSGFGQSVNALGSLTMPYCLPVLLIVSMRGTGPDTTRENLAMGRLTPMILDGLGVEFEYLTGETAHTQMKSAYDVVAVERRAFCFLIRPDEFEWSV